MYLFGNAVLVMSFRILTGRSNPAKGKDTEFMQIVNRIIGNTIEQSIVFAGLFGNILFGDYEVSESKVLALASIFVVCRAWYCVGYMVAHLSGIPAFRSGAFAMNLTLNIVMIGIVMGLDVFTMIENYGVF